MNKAELMAFKSLGLEIDSAPQVVKDRWRKLRSKYHPDHGGDAAHFHELSRAYDIAIAAAMRPTPCLACDGSGKRYQKGGFLRMGLVCSRCNGTGVREPH